MNSKERKILSLFRKLDDTQKAMLTSYGEFLTSEFACENSSNIEILQPKMIEVQKGESVIGALKRLSASYFMLESSTLLNTASTLMTQHVMQGREAVEVIAELEQLFQSGYEEYCQAIHDKLNLEIKD